MNYRERLHNGDMDSSPLGLIDNSSFMRIMAQALPLSNSAERRGQTSLRVWNALLRHDRYFAKSDDEKLFQHRQVFIVTPDGESQEDHVSPRPYLDLDALANQPLIGGMLPIISIGHMYTKVLAELIEIRQSSQ